MQNIAGCCQQTQKVYDITQQYFALLLQGNFIANNLNFLYKDEIKFSEFKLSS